MDERALPERPLLKPWYRLAEDGERLLLEYAHAVHVLEGRATTKLLPALLPLLDGRHTVEEIVTKLGAPAAPAVEHALALLDRQRLLTDGWPAQDGDVPASVQETVSFLAATARRSVGGGEVANRLAAATVAVAGSGGIGEDAARVLRLSGVPRVERIELTSRPDPLRLPDLAIAAPRPEELPRLAEWNRSALAAGIPWLQALPFDGRLAAIGPLYVPGETCCYECFRIRRASNSGYAAELRVLERAPARYPVAPALALAVVGIVATQALRWLVERDPLLPGVLHAVEYGGELALTAHEVYRVPRCSACSRAEGEAPPLPWFEAEVRS